MWRIPATSWQWEWLVEMGILKRLGEWKDKPEVEMGILERLREREAEPEGVGMGIFERLKEREAEPDWWTLSCQVITSRGKRETLIAWGWNYGSVNVIIIGDGESWFIKKCSHAPIYPPPPTKNNSIFFYSYILYKLRSFFLRLWQFCFLTKQGGRVIIITIYIKKNSRQFSIKRKKNIWG